MPGAQCARSLVCSVLVAHECRHHGHTGKTPGIPCAMVLTVSFVLSPVTNSFLSPSGRPIRHPDLDKPALPLTPATGARTTRLHRPRKRRSSALCLAAHGHKVPALQTKTPRLTLSASTASRPASVTIANRPSGGRDDAENLPVSTRLSSANFGISEIFFARAVRCCTHTVS
jgi:hypothetical protein